MPEAERQLAAFLSKLGTLPSGYSIGQYCTHRYGLTIDRLSGGRQVKLYAEALGYKDHVSFNLYLPRSGRVVLKPCEMTECKVMDFVLGVQLDAGIRGI